MFKLEVVQKEREGVYPRGMVETYTRDTPQVRFLASFSSGGNMDVFAPNVSYVLVELSGCIIQSFKSKLELRARA